MRRLKIWQMSVLAGMVICIGVGVLIWRRPADEKLREAAARGDTAAVHDLASNGTDINSPNADGSTPLMFASAAGHIGTVRELLRLGATVDLSAHSGHQDTALYYAVLNNHSEVAAILLQAGADPNTMMGGIYCPIVIASRKCELDMLRTLTGSSELDVNARDDRGNTPLLLVLVSDSPVETKASSLRLLVARGADPLLANSAGETACHLACGQNERRLIEALGSCQCNVLPSRPERGR